jgi:secreted trypsin-like serine protease
MKWLLLLALISTILSATLAFVDVESRIVGGNPAIQNQIPYIVSMRVKATNAHFCGGKNVFSKTSAFIY